MILGEAPIYRACDSTLHWVDCLSEPCELYILQVDPETGDAIPDTLRILALKDSVTVQFFRKGKPGSYIAAYYQGVCFLDEETGQMEIVKEIIPTEKRDELRFNDGGIDAKGRFWLAEIDKVAMAYGPNQLPASYGRAKGKLWRYDPDGSLHEMLDGGVICGNGLGWSPDNKTCTFFVSLFFSLWEKPFFFFFGSETTLEVKLMKAVYFHDSVAMIVYAFDFDLEFGNISNKRILIDRRDSFGEPDGMVVE